MNQSVKISTGWVIFFVLVLIVAGYFLFSGDAAAPDINQENSTSTDSSMTEDVDTNMTDEESESEMTVDYDGSSFSPSSITVSVGETVTFVNNSGSGMWVASAVHPTHAAYGGTSLNEHCDDGSSFDACQEIAPGESWSFTFDKSGEWQYHDHLNASNTGTVVVQ